MSKCQKMLLAAVLLAFLSGARADVGGQWITIAVETAAPGAREPPRRPAPDSSDRCAAVCVEGRGRFTCRRDDD
jgi:hypothetical protein